MTALFMSYRRDDSASITGRVYDHLTARFGAANVFKDVDAIPAGANFGSYIRESLKQCEIALVFIGRHWLDTTDERGARRLDDPADWVRVEIEMALSLGLAVIPVLVEGARMPKVAELPEPLRGLVEINSLEVRNDPDFARDMQRAIITVERILQERASTRPPYAEGWSHESGSAWSEEQYGMPQAWKTSTGMETGTGGGWGQPPVETGVRTQYVGATAGTRAAKAARNTRLWRVVVSGVLAVVVLGAAVLAVATLGKFLGSNTAPFTSVAVVPGSSIEAWAVGDRGRIAHFSDGKWANVSSPVSMDLTSLSMVSESDGWAVGLAGTIVHYHGEQWTSEQSPVNDNLYSVAMVSLSDGWAGGALGVLLHYTGGQWKRVEKPTTVDLEGMTMVSPSEGWAVGHYGTLGLGGIAHYHDGTWSEVTDPTGLGYHSVSMDSASDGWAVGSSSAGLLHYSGGQWVEVHLKDDVSLRGVAMVSATEGWAVGDGGVILHYTGGSWTRVSSPTSGDLVGVAMVSATEGWAVGRNGNMGILLIYSSGKWQEMSVATA